MARRARRVPAKSIRDLRAAVAADSGSVTISAASDTTNDGPTLTKSSVAPEASPAKTKSKPKAKK